MLNRPVVSYIEWLSGDLLSSSQPYEHLAHRFHQSGEPHKSNDILYAARERQRRSAWATVDDGGNPKKREWLRASGLYLLRVTIGYGLGMRYFYALWWVGGLTLAGAWVLLCSWAHLLEPWPGLVYASRDQLVTILTLFLASLDQLLPIITLNEAHDALIFGDPSANPPIEARRYGVVVYFYVHKILGWILGSFLVAGLAGLTQRN